MFEILTLLLTIALLGVLLGPVFAYMIAVDKGLKIRGHAQRYMNAELSGNDRSTANRAWFRIDMDDLGKEIFRGRDPWLLYPPTLQAARDWRQP